MAARYHVYDPGLGGDCVIDSFDAIDAAIVCANETIQNNWRPDQGEEWSDEVTGVAVYLADGTDDLPENGTIMAAATEVDVAHRPDDVDEDGNSETDTAHWWGASAPDYYCDYKVVIVQDHPHV